MKMDYKIVLLVFSCAFGVAVGQLRCYACSFSTEDSDDSCLTITNSTRTVACRFRYCTIYRQEFIDGGAVASFLRGCEQRPDHLNHDVADSDFRTYYRACTSNLCNIGNGIQEVGGGKLLPSPQYAGENLVVPGTGRRNDAFSLKMNILILFISILIAINL